MKKISVKDLAEIIKAGSKTAGVSNDITGISTDSRTVKSGDCFFAISGENFDGHNFIADVFAKGAACAVVSKTASISNQQSAISNKVILKVDDTVKALGDLACWYRKDCKFKVVAITGSVGKTTTRQIVYHVLSQHFKTYQSPKSFNNFIGLPLTLLGAEPNQQIIIVELGTSHPGEIEYLTRIASPDIALVTNVYPAHLAGFGSVEKIAEEKLAISKGLSPGGKLIINFDCRLLLDSVRRLKLVFDTTSCFNDDADYSIDNLIMGPLASNFSINKTIVEIPLPGRGNVENALAAWAICSNFGITAAQFADALKTISPVSMRTEMLQLGAITVISDCYNANPASMKNALDILSRLPAAQNRQAACPGDLSGVALAKTEAQRRRVFICGNMAELGDAEQVLHRQLGEQIANAGVNLLITLGNLAALAADAAKTKRPDIQTRCFADQTDLCNNLQLMIKDSDIILVKGSRINKLELVVDKLKKLFSEPR